MRLGGVDFALYARHFFGAERAHAGIGIGEHFPGGRQIALEFVIATIALRERLQTGIFHGQVPKLLGAARHFGGREQPADLLEAIGHLL